MKLSELSKKQKEIILTFSENNMNSSKTARSLYMASSTIEYHLKMILHNTGLNPKRFYDLIILVEIASH